MLRCLGLHHVNPWCVFLRLFQSLLINPRGIHRFIGVLLCPGLHSFNLGLHGDFIVFFCPRLHQGSLTLLHGDFNVLLCPMRQ